MTFEDFLRMNESSIGPTGGDWDSCDGLLYLNKARSALYGIDNWHGLIQTICVNECNGLILPWFASRAIGAYKCNGIIPIDEGEYWANALDTNCGAPLHIVDANQTIPVPISNEFNSRIGVKLGDFNDVGAEITITYETGQGSVVTEKLVVNEKMKMVVSDGSDHSVTETSVKKVYSIKKPDTHGPIRFYEVDSDGNCCKILFTAHALETHLQYKRYCFVGGCCSPCSPVTVKVKKKYLPVTDRHYNFPVDFPDHALGLAMEAVAARAKRTTEGLNEYNALLSSAINYLRKNEIKEKTTFGDIGQTNDYPDILG